MYVITLVYFLLGFTAFYFINRKKEPLQSRKSWIKTITYFFIINIVFFSIAINALVFRYLAVIIIIAGFFELFKLFRESGYKMKTHYVFSTAVYAIFSFGFFVYSGFEKGLILFSFMVLSIFDSFSQITGEILGRNKLFPKISPQKTIEGLVGGVVVAIMSSLLLKGLIPAPPVKAMLLAAGVTLFAFTGDFLKSYYKRKYNVKDFSNLIPEHGGFLDRFDSLIAGGSFIGLLGLLIQL